MATLARSEVALFSPSSVMTDAAVQVAADEFQGAEWATAEEAAARLHWDEQRAVVRAVGATEESHAGDAMRRHPRARSVCASRRVR